MVVTRRYTLEELEDTERRFPDRLSLRMAINECVQVGEELTIGEIADRLGIVPRMTSTRSRKNYGVRYTVYEKLRSLLNFECGRNVENTRKEGRNTYTLLNRIRTSKMPLDRTRTPDSIEDRFLKALDSIKGSIYSKTAGCTRITEEAGVSINRVSAISKKLENSGRIARIPKPAVAMTGGFLDDLFPRYGYLILRSEWLDEFARDIISRLPDEIPSTLKSYLDNELEVLRRKGLHESVYREAKRAYAHKPVLAIEEPENGKRNGMRRHKADIFGTEFLFVGNTVGRRRRWTGDLWIADGRLIRLVSLERVAEDGGIARLYESMKRVGYDMPEPDEFNKKLSKELQTYDILSS